MSDYDYADKVSHYNFLKAMKLPEKRIEELLDLPSGEFVAFRASITDFRRRGRPVQSPIYKGQKVCTACLLARPLEYFHKNSSTSSGYVNTCNVCKGYNAIMGDSQSKPHPDILYYQKRLKTLGAEEYKKQFSRLLRRAKAMKTVLDAHNTAQEQQNSLTQTLGSLDEEKTP